MAMVKWAVATAASYAASAKDTNTIYFLSDTGEIYKGAAAYGKGAESFAGIAARPAAGAEGRLYVDSTNGAGYIYANGAWSQVIKPVDTTVAQGGVNPVTGDAVVTYVTEQINEVTGGALTDVAYNQATKTLSVTKAGQKTDTVITGVVTGMSYENGVLKVTDVEGTEVATVNLELERYLQDAYYDEATSSLVFEVKVEGATEATKITVPAAEFVALYEATDSNTIDMTIEAVEGGANKISGTVKVSAEAGNQIVAKEDGLFVAATDISGKMDLVAGATANDIAALNANGQAVDSGKAFGGAVFADAPAETVIPNEASVAAYVGAKITANNGDKDAQIAATYITKEDSAAAVKVVADDLAEVDGRLVTAEGEIDALQAEDTAIKEAATALAGRVTTAEGEITTIKANAEALAGRVTTAEGEIDTLQADVAAIKTDYVKVADVVAEVASETATTKVASEAAVVKALSWQTV